MATPLVAGVAWDTEAALLEAAMEEAGVMVVAMLHLEVATRRLVAMAWRVRSPSEEEAMVVGRPSKKCGQHRLKGLMVGSCIASKTATSLISTTRGQVLRSGSVQRAGTHKAVV